MDMENAKDVERECAEKMVNTVFCEVCGSLIPVSEAVETCDHYHVCQDCVEREYVECNCCGELIPRDDAKEGTDGEIYCESCFDDDFFVCPHCGKVEYIDDAVAVYDDADMDIADFALWCKECATEDAHRCDDCERYFRYRQDVNEDDAGHCLCDTCFDEGHYRRCENCNEILSEDDQYYSDIDDCCYCEHCLPGDGGDVIHNYHSNIRPLNWHGGNGGSLNERRNQLFMGWELEIDRDDWSKQPACDAESIVAAAGYDVDESIVCEQDGSLNYGFELISSTATLDYHLNHYGIDDLMKEAVELGYTSHDAGTCGLHVHVDRTYFLDAFENPENNACIILVNNKAWLKKFSRRDNFEYCEFPTVNVEPFYPEEFKPGVPDVLDKLPERDAMATLEEMRHKMRDHYHALNFRGNSTIEFRFNRGTLSPETFKATLQLIQMYADAIKHSRLDTACKISLKWFRRVAKQRGYTEFLSYLKRHNIQ